MSDNKVNNQLDFRNVKNSQLNGSQIERAEFSELLSSKRVFNTNNILKDAYTHFIQTVDGFDRPTRVEYWQATSPAIDKLAVSADIAGSKAGTYFTLQEYITKKTHVFYFVVSGSGTAPGIGDIETAINIVTNDAASVVALAVQSAINLVDEFTASRTSILSSFVSISYLQFGETSGVDVGTSGFTVTRTKEGTSFQVGEVDLDYNVDGHLIWNSNILKGYTYNVFKGEFEVTSDTQGSITPSNPILLVDNQSSSLIYIGEAEINTAKTEAKWQIKKVEIIGTETSITFADADDKYDNIWNDRGSLIYG